MARINNNNNGNDNTNDNIPRTCWREPINVGDVVRVVGTTDPLIVLSVTRESVVCDDLDSLIDGGGRCYDPGELEHTTQPNPAGVHVVAWDDENPIPEAIDLRVYDDGEYADTIRYVPDERCAEATDEPVAREAIAYHVAPQWPAAQEMLERVLALA